MVYADLVNSSRQRATNAAAIVDAKLSIGDVFSLQDKSITIGEWIAEKLPHNRLEDIVRNMNILIGRDNFFTEIMNNRWVTTIFQSSSNNQKFNVEALLVETFRLRHIFCHELAPKECPQIKLIYDSCFAALCLACATEECLSDSMRARNP